MILEIKFGSIIHYIDILDYDFEKSKKLINLYYGTMVNISKTKKQTGWYKIYEILWPNKFINFQNYSYNNFYFTILDECFIKKLIKDWENYAKHKPYSISENDRRNIKHIKTNYKKWFDELTIGEIIT